MSSRRAVPLLEEGNGTAKELPRGGQGRAQSKSQTFREYVGRRREIARGTQIAGCALYLPGNARAASSQ